MKVRHRERTKEKEKHRGWGERRGEIQFLQAILSVVLTRQASFYQCSFSVNLGKSERNGVG